MTLVKWKESVHLAKIKNNVDPNSFTVIKGKLLKEAQKIYIMLLSTE
tara:strand:+ start:994 stop:1134 length:141 start_codon:yes stop_codon:yes gene_type:complete